MHQKIVSRVTGKRSLSSKCCYLTVNEIGFDLLECVVVDLEGIEDVRTIVDRDDVGLRNKPVDDRLTFFRVQIKADRSLAPIDRDESLTVGISNWSDASAPWISPRWLNLDNVRAQVAAARERFLK